MTTIKLIKDGKGRIDCMAKEPCSSISEEKCHECPYFIKFVPIVSLNIG